MPCPAPPSPPTLAELLAQLTALNPASAENLRPEVDALEQRLADARAQLAAAETEFLRVSLDQAAYGEWTRRHGDAVRLRSKERLLGVDVGCMRERLERELYLARRSIALGRHLCPDCGGTGEGELLDGGTSLVATGCDSCEGTGFVARSASGA
ncbi:hypothetical protein JQX13_38975 [Archangium violaceum]|uniref:hypothetical protein n=1 Tax=Archangium violaceum TaxID=83451 RepID=UPI00193B4629|nr:hypothetical protein [Archangium violaceum]QRK06066.1 hypothetical protein JQX13_38975 [Archangium violaceum]